MNKDLQEAVEWTEKIDGNLMRLITEATNEFQKDPSNKFLAYMIENLMAKRAELLDLQLEYGPKANPDAKVYYYNRNYNQKGALHDISGVIKGMQESEITQTESSNRAQFK